MLNLNDLRVFAKVVEHGGFSAASRQMGDPKSTLSKRVAALEDSLGGRLLHRNARTIALTPLGEDVLMHARAMLVEADAARAVAERLQAEPAGVVRITCGTITAQYHLAPLWPGVIQRYPRLVPLVHATDRMVDIVAEGFDLALRDHKAPLSDSDLMQLRLGSEPDYLVAAPGFATALPEKVQDFEQVPALGNAASGRGEAWHLRRGDDAITVKPQVRFASDDPCSVLSMALAGHGVARLPKVVCAPQLATGALIRVLPDWHAEGPMTTLLYPSRRGQLPAVRAVIERIAAEMGDRLLS
jgi:DNA-binding transcriptional LysR family regulator